MMPWYWKCLPRKCLVKVRVKVRGRVKVRVGVRVRACGGGANSSRGKDVPPDVG